MITVTESGVTFGPFAETAIFRVEKSPYSTRLSGIKTCEFAWWSADHGKLVFIEAKTSVPNSKTSQLEFEKYFTEMLEKFDNSLQLMLAGTQARHADLAAELGPDMATLNWQQADILFYLVIPKAPKAHLIGLTDKLRLTLGRQLKIWRADAFVINEQMARSKGLLAEAT